MITSLAAPQAKGKKAQDVIFGANAMAVAAAKVHGVENVVNATIGAILDEDEKLVFLKSVEEVYRNLPANEYSAYAPIEGLPDYLEAVISECFGNHRPKGYIRAIATAGGTGGIHHLVHNYTAMGDEVLTSDWYWGAYSSLCDDNGRTLRTYTLFNEALEFNHEDFQANVRAMAEKQDNLLIIINSPAHNPTGFSLTSEDWDKVLAFFKEITADGKKHVILDLDVAYLDYAGEKQEARQFFEKFSDLPEAILVVVGYSMSKSYTMYGQRVGAIIGISSNETIAEEFYDINQYTSRATWSNICRPAMRTMVELASDPAKQAAYEAERNSYYLLTQERAAIFMEEAKEVGLPVLPYKAGFFISIPSPNSKAVCEALHEENIFLVPLKKGIRIAVCAVSKKKMVGLAGKVYEAMKKVGQI